MSILKKFIEKYAKTVINPDYYKKVEIVGKNMAKKTNYVVGFCFNKNKDMVVLIEKLKPTWQQGLLNGVGGKVEDGENAQEAMAREFKEETGAYTFQYNWRLFATMTGDAWEVDCFMIVDEDVFKKASTKTDEKIFKLNINDVYKQASQTVSNLPWLIPMALDENYGNTFLAKVEYK